VLKGLMLNMPPPAAVLLNMVSLSFSLLMFQCFSCSNRYRFRFFVLSVFLINKDVYIANTALCIASYLMAVCSCFTVLMIKVD